LEFVITLSSDTLRIDFEIEFAVMQDCGLNVAIKGMGERVKIIDASGLCFLITEQIPSRFFEFSSTEDNLKPCLSSSN
jgi:hypothetical protein